MSVDLKKLEKRVAHLEIENERRFTENKSLQRVVDKIASFLVQAIGKLNKRLDGG